MKTIEVSEKGKTAKMVLVIVLGVTLAAGALALAGCSTPVGEDVSKRVKDLEDRVKVLEDKVITKVEEGHDKDRTYSETENYATYDKYLAEIEKHVSDAVEATAPSSVPTEADKRTEAYDKAVESFEDLEDQLGHLKNAYVAAKANGAISENELTQLNAYAEKIYGDISMAVANLKSTYGITS